MMNFKGNAKILFFLLVLADGFQEGLSAKSLICFGRNVMELKDFVACLFVVEVGDFTNSYSSLCSVRVGCWCGNKIMISFCIWISNLWFCAHCMLNCWMIWKVINSYSLIHWLGLICVLSVCQCIFDSWWSDYVLDAGI